MKREKADLFSWLGARLGEPQRGPMLVGVEANFKVGIAGDVLRGASWYCPRTAIMGTAADPWMGEAKG